MGRRTWLFVVVAAALGAVVGPVYSVSLDEVCIGGGDVFACGYRSFFGWEIIPLAAWAVWTAIGVAIGGIVGFVANRATRRT